MKYTLLHLAILSGLMAGCSTTSSPNQVAGGGFETSDLQAIVIGTNGRPVVSARVWLLTDTGASSTASALDSMSSDASGRVGFQVRDSLKPGLESWSGDSLAAVVQNLTQPFANPVVLMLLPTHSLSLPCASFGMDTIAIPGSHFMQRPPPTCVDSFQIVIPAGNWNIMALPPAGFAQPLPFPVRSDSLPLWRPSQPPPQGGPWGP